ncbi:hypothetical protein DFR74_101655 [Nocardia puris]|uniref:Uncharacterized protein n=2 Tax=Nocardia puris TaxID=208602 RepID=A0A366E4C1_9NOCA|nr:hypothetical protein DFR74_101655 [Nocardia puris]
MRALAYGRIALGLAALAAPRRSARLARVHPTPELTYMTRIYGARALALGLGYLTASPTDRPRWHHLALMVDALDTTTGGTELTRGTLPRGLAAGFTGLTGAYLAVGAFQLAGARRG